MSDFPKIRQEIIEKEYKHLNDMQKQAVFSTEGPLLVLAGAGSGKTTVIVNKIAHLMKYGKAYTSKTVPRNFSEEELEIFRWYRDGEIDELSPDLEECLWEEPVPPYNILAITFTNKAAGELKERLEARLGPVGRDVHAGTFHSMCARILRRNIEEIGYTGDYVIYDSADRQTVIKDCLRDLNIDEKRYSPRLVGTLISAAKDKLIDPLDYRAEAEKDYYLQPVAKVYTEYSRRLKDSNALDFDDLLMLTVRLFEDCPDVLEYYRNKYKYILVDEYQDTDYAQYRLVSLLAEKHRNLCVVGDDDQSIYKFRGADIRNILDFEKDFPDAEVIKLEENYRSTQHILDAANGVIKNNGGRKGKSLWTSNGSGEKITLRIADNEHSEARFVADTIENLGGKLNDTAVLYRVNAQSRIIEDALLRAAIPYKVFGGLRFYDRKEIKDIGAYLRLIANSDDQVALKRIINEPKRGIGASTLEKISALSASKNMSMFAVCERAKDFSEFKSTSASGLIKFSDMIKDLRADLEEGMGLELFVRTVMKTSGMIDALQKEKNVENRTKLENLDEFLSMVKEAVRENADITLNELLENISLISDIDNYDEAQEAVTLMTLHSAKGLEFKNIFLVGMEEGLFPGSQAYGDEEELEEERRLCYVGITRAKSRLFLTAAKQRTLFGQTRYNLPSRFLDEIPKDLIEKTEDLHSFAERDFGGYGYGRRRYGGAYGGFAEPSYKKETVPMAVSDEEYKPGDRVRHRKFGEGTVVSAKEMGRDWLVVVDFDEVGRKNMMAAYSNFERL